MPAVVKTVRVKALVSAVYQTPEGIPVSMQPNLEHDLPESMVDEFIRCGHVEVLGKNRTARNPKHSSFKGNINDGQ